MFVMYSLPGTRLRYLLYMIDMDFATLMKVLNIEPESPDYEMFEEIFFGYEESLEQAADIICERFPSVNYEWLVYWNRACPAARTEDGELKNYRITSRILPRIAGVSRWLSAWSSLMVPWVTNSSPIPRMCTRQE